VGRNNLEESATSIFRMKNWKQYALPKHPHLYAKARGITSLQDSNHHEKPKSRTHIPLSFVVQRDGTKIWN